MCLNLAAGPAKEEEKEPQQAETCPCCAESNLTYGDSGLADAQYFYHWTCGECGATGTEWFDLVFSEHIIKTPGTPSEAAA